MRNIVAASLHGAHSALTRIFAASLPLVVLGAALSLNSCAATKDVPSQTPDKPSPASSPAKTQSSVAPTQSLQELTVREDRGQTTLLVKFAQPVTQYRHFTLPQPARIVLDILDISKGAAAEDNYRIDTNWVSTLRVNVGENNLRLVVEIAGATVPAYTISPENGGLSIVIGDSDPKATAKKNVTLVKDGKRVDLAAGGLACGPLTDERKAPPEKQYAGQKISLEFKDADIKNIFRLLGEVSGKNVVVTDDVNRKVTVRLLEVPWDQALDIIVETNGLAKEETDNILRISTAGRLAQDKKAQLDVRNATISAQERQTSYINVNYGTAKDLVDKVKQIVKSGGPDIVPDERTNMIVVRGTIKDLQEVTCIVSRLDVRTPQILIESNLVETTPSFARALGFRFQFDRGGGRFSSSAQPGAPFNEVTGQFAPAPTINPDGSQTAVPPIFPSGLGGAIQFFQGRAGGIQNLLAALEAAENEGNVKIISRPSVVTLNRKTSTIRSQRILRIALPSSTNIASGSGAAAGTAVATQEIPVGIQLAVTPQVSSDGFILMDITVESSSVASSATVSTGTAGVVPFDTLTRNAQASVLVRDGETIVIGGILKDTATEATSGIPYLKDIPVFGWLFKNWNVQKSQEELIVFITPRIASAGSENLPTADELWREQMKKTVGTPAISSQSTP